MHLVHYTVIFKVAFSTFWFKFGATLRRQAERRDSGTRQKVSNLHHKQASCRIPSFIIVPRSARLGDRLVG